MKKLSFILIFLYFLLKTNLIYPQCKTCEAEKTLDKDYKSILNLAKLKKNPPLISPYLKLPSINLINWYQFGWEAFDKAEKLGKPMLLTIGTASSYLCRLMDKENYEDLEIAKIINESFIPIKVDKDERPDIALVYQLAFNLKTGAYPEWPLILFLNKYGEPFSGITYLPKEDDWGITGFKSILVNIVKNYYENNELLTITGSEIHNQILKLKEMAPSAEPLSLKLIDPIFKSIEKEFDPLYGGFGSSSKFISNNILNLLFVKFFENRSKETLEMITTTLDAIYKGGIHDHIGGGVFHYTKDRRWNLPQFEKVSHLNAKTALTFLIGYKITGNKIYKNFALEIINYLNQVFLDKKGGFFYAYEYEEDAEKAKGKYFTWKLDEIKGILSEKEQRAFISYYNIKELPEDIENAPKENILHIKKDKIEIANELKIPIEEFEELIKISKEKLLKVRNERKPPLYIDKRLFCDFNASIIFSYLEMYKILGDNKLKEIAINALNFLIKNLYQKEKGMCHLYSEGKCYQGTPFLLYDQAITSLALINAYEITGNKNYIEFAKKLIDYSIKSFWDKTNSAFFEVIPEEGALGLTDISWKSVDENDNLSGNALMGYLLTRYYHFAGIKEYKNKAEATLQFFADKIVNTGRSNSLYALSIYNYLTEPLYILIIAKSDFLDESILKNAFSSYQPNKVVLRLTPQDLKNLKLSEPIKEYISKIDISKIPITISCKSNLCEEYREKLEN